MSCVVWSVVLRMFATCKRGRSSGPTWSALASRLPAKLHGCRGQGGGQAVPLEQRNGFYNPTMAMLEQVARRAARLAHIDRRAMPAALREQRDATERKRLGFDAIEQALVRFVGAVYVSRKKSGKGILADAAAAALALPPSPSGAALQQEVVESILGAATTRITI